MYVYNSSFLCVNNLIEKILQNMTYQTRVRDFVILIAFSLSLLYVECSRVKNKKELYIFAKDGRTRNIVYIRLINLNGMSTHLGFKP